MVTDVAQTVLSCHCQRCEQFTGTTVSVKCLLPLKQRQIHDLRHVSMLNYNTDVEIAKSEQNGFK